jgi:hypothetical protein
MAYSQGGGSSVSSGITCSWLMRSAVLINLLKSGKFFLSTFFLHPTPYYSEAIGAFVFILILGHFDPKRILNSRNWIHRPQA